MMDDDDDDNRCRSESAALLAPQEHALRVPRRVFHASHSTRVFRQPMRHTTYDTVPHLRDAKVQLSQPIFVNAEPDALKARSDGLNLMGVLT